MPDTKWRDWAVAVGAGLVVLGFVLYAVFSLGRQVNSTGGIEGIITEKEFVARSETQITVGQAGVQRRDTAGEYVLHVKAPPERGKMYNVRVSATVYATEQVGDRYYFVRPKD